MSDHDDVGLFHDKFGLVSTQDYNAGPTIHTLKDAEMMDFRIKFIQEELDELIKGLSEQDISQVADALIDIAYVVHGMAHILGLPWQELWDDVQRANMSKQRALSDGSDSRRGSQYDVVKPEGWKGPETFRVLVRYGFFE